MNITNINDFIELIPDIAFLKNLKGEYLYFNDAFLSFLELQREDVTNKTVFDFYQIENAAKFSSDDKEILASNKSRVYEEVFKKDNEDDIYFFTSKQIIYDDKKNQLGLFCIVKDITLQKQYEHIYKDSQLILEYIAIHDDLREILDKIVMLAQNRNSNSICSILLLDKERKHLLSASAPNLPDFYNEAINGIAIGAKVGSCGSATFKKERVIVENIDTHENWQPYLGLTQKANLHACWSEPIFSSKDEVLGSFAIYNNKPKTPSAFELKMISSYAHLASVAIEKENNAKLLKEKEFQILEQIKRANEQLKDVASKDYLTGLYNRIKLDEVLQYQFNYSKRYGNIFGIILIDIDFFKDVNDEYGHQVGDSVLCEFAELLRAGSRETDTVSRWGGEEFLIVVENIAKESILLLAEKLRTRIEMYRFSKVNHKTASFGVAVYTEDDTISTLVARVDQALYEAKNGGRNRVVFK